MTRLTTRFTGNTTTATNWIAQLFVEMNDKLVNDVVVIPLVRQADIAGVSNTLVGVDPTPWDADLWNIKSWKRSTP